ncbi:MAG: hypothetical protein KDJ41_19080, partial [Hyphomicrobiaceae bacterium]|nr:hypothetical protein [Hyphomicrobiaceae bacterium]
MGKLWTEHAPAAPFPLGRRRLRQSPKPSALKIEAGREVVRLAGRARPAVRYVGIARWRAMWAPPHEARMRRSRAVD